ncbi:MAG: tRNA (adenosine(37)-N6)-threonylcarbamoyltransferase complex dimerization subunit type 1 TsaB [Gammaproteobacteria bacterium]|nr:tRNA (adenosine(37)-N6)-threonylcarbamoyltransferase complex dimerization subunit type 1 TsaB [Gammaproteobacteria bacterium]MCY4226832.1 tRNA (adenosine(37)-N6)-threonylcarbamoyltransferase complex dimerization subunit type 1 TsaB [Gammaproteobacteria bacterium]
MSKINILAMDTATRNCSVALYAQGKISRLSRESMKHSSELIELIQNVLVGQGLTLNDLHMVIVNTGPGSFTGVRTGIGVAQGIAYGLGIPLCGIDSLSILATASGKRGIVLPIMDARMKQVYAGLYSIDDDLRVMLSPYVCDPDDIQTMKQQKFTVVGDGWHLYQSIFQMVLGDRAQFLETIVYPDAASAIDAFIRYGLGKTGSPLALSATYIRDNVVQGKLSR